MPEAMGLTAQEAATLNDLLHKVRGAVSASGFRRQLTTHIEAVDEPRPARTGRTAKVTG